MNIIEAWVEAERGQQIEFVGTKNLIWRLTKKPKLSLIELAYKLGIGEDAFLSDRWVLLS